MYPRYWQHCAALNKKNVQCGNNGNCPHHKEANRIRHREDDDARIALVRESNQLTLEYGLSRDRIKELIELGRQQSTA